MKVYVSIDIEGLPGIASITMASPGRTQYSRGARIMTAIAKEIGSSLLEKGFKRVVIADSHGLMTNIEYLDMPRGVTIIQGYPRPYSMVVGLDSSFNALLLVGYHAGAGTIHGFLDHTMSGRTFHEILVNGVRASEYLLNTLYAGEKGVPVVLVAGDSHLRSDVEKHTPWAVFIELKRGITRYAAEYDSFEEVVERLKEGVSQAVDKLKAGEAKPLRVQKPYKVLVRVRDTLLADVLELIGILDRKDAYTFEFETSSAEKLLATIEEIAYIGYGIESLKTSIR